MICSKIVNLDADMKRFMQIMPVIFFILPSLVFAEGMSYLNFTVTNLTNTRVFFKSKDLFDFGKGVGKNETKTVTYDFPPKMITIKIQNDAHQSYDITTDPSCDILGWPSFRQMTHINNGEDVKGIAIYKAGNVHITISDMSGSTMDKKHLSCELSHG